jgi:aryl-alcohol dehydrogenase-like predicted oxidoreductase
VEYRKLGSTGMMVSSLCLGTMMFGSPTEESESIAMVHRALDAGVNFVDTANVYARTRSEEIVGKALLGRRHEVVLATKVRFAVAPGPNGSGNSRYHIMREVENSLRRLQTDHVDVYFLHKPDPVTSIEEEVETMSDLVRQGKIRYFGTSHYSAWQICRGLWYADVAKLARWVVDQPRYSLIDRAIEADVVPFCQAMGYGLVNHSPLAGGFLTGKYLRERSAPVDSRVGRTGDPWIQAWMRDERNWAVLDGVMSIARARGCSPSQIALAWAAAKPFISSAIVGPRTIEQLEDNLGAADVRLSAEETDALDEASDFATRIPRD